MMIISVLEETFAWPLYPAKERKPNNLYKNLSIFYFK